MIYHRLRGAGYTGGRTVLRLYIQPKRALRPGGDTVRYETPPGAQLQHDWGERQRVYLALQVLGHSGGLHGVALPCCDTAHT